MVTKSTLLSLSSLLSRLSASLTASLSASRLALPLIFAEAPKIDLFQFFWRELKMCGVRVYEPEDYDKAIALTASGELPLEKLVTERLSLDGLPDAFARLEAGTDAVKILIDTQGG